MNENNEKPAKGTRGFLLGLNKKVFRVYDEHDRSKFVDYDIHHCDLKIEIIDDSAAFYETDKGASPWLDYTSEALNTNGKSSKSNLP